LPQLWPRAAPTSTARSGWADTPRLFWPTCPRARLVGIDRDPDALAIARQRLAPFGDRVALYEAVYDEITEVLAEDGTPQVQAILADLGLSSMQIDRRERGFSYAADAPLDMRMSPGAGRTAADVLNTASAAELTRILRVYGEERFADRIARRVVLEREAEPYVTSARLVATIDAAIPAAARHAGGHPAKRTFQALRIEVNGELAALEGLLPAALDALAPWWPVRGAGLPLVGGSPGQALVQRGHHRHRPAGAAGGAARAPGALRRAHARRRAAQRRGSAGQPAGGVCPAAGRGTT
jgi:hypothetical protein